METIRLNKHQLADLLDVTESMARKAANDQGWVKHQDNPNSPSSWDIPITYLKDRGADLSKVAMTDGNGCELAGRNSLGNSQVGCETLYGQGKKKSTPLVGEVGMMDGKGVGITQQPAIGWPEFSAMNLSEIYCLYINLKTENIQLRAENRAVHFENASLVKQLSMMEHEGRTLRTIINDKQQQLERLEPLVGRLIDNDLLKRPIEYLGQNKKALTSMVRTLVAASQATRIDYSHQAMTLYSLARIMPPEQFEPFQSQDVDGLLEFIGTCRNHGYKVQDAQTPEAIAFIQRVMSMGAAVVDLASVRGGGPC
jgi:hypothetical protein